MLRIRIGLILLAFSSSDVFSASIVEMRDQSGGKSQFYSDGSMGRLNPADGQSYILVDYSKNGVKFVVPQQKQIYDVSEQLALLDTSSAGAKSESLSLHDKGAGPTIAGYETTQYDLMLDEESCGTVFSSRKALEDSGLGQMFRVLRKIALQQVQALTAVKSQVPPCQLGKLNSMEQILSVGAPLRTQDENGNVESEVLKVEQNASLPADIFSVPAEYKVINALDESKKMKEKAESEIKEKIPALEKKLAELQKSGKMRPQELEKLKKMIEHYKQQK